MSSRAYHSVVRERGAAVTRAAVVAAAADVFAELGFTAATIAEIAKRAEVGVNTIYAKFGTKARLLAEVLGAVAGSEAAQVTMADIRSAATGFDVLRRLASGIRRNTEPTYGLVGVALYSLREDPLIMMAYNAAVDEYRGRVGYAVDRIGALGDLRDGLSRHDATDVLWFFLGVNAWRVLIDQGWSWSRAQHFLSEQAGAAVLRPGALSE